MKPFYILIAVFIICLFVTRYATGDYLHFLSGKIAMSAMLVFTATGHFAFTKGMSMMVPDFLPFKRTLVYLTGILEILFAIGLLMPLYTKLTAWSVLIFLVLVIPGNVRAAMRHVDYQKGTNNGPGLTYLWFRIPLQLFFIAWTWFFALRPSF